MCLRAEIRRFIRVPVFPDDCHGEAHDFTDCATLGFTERCGGLSTVYARPGEKPYVCVP